MRRACTACGRVVAEAAYCPFCLQPTIEYIPPRKEKKNNLPKKEELELRPLQRFWMRFGSALVSLAATILGAYTVWQSVRPTEVSIQKDEEFREKFKRLQTEIDKGQKEINQRQKEHD